MHIHRQHLCSLLTEFTDELHSRLLPSLCCAASIAQPVAHREHLIRHLQDLLAPVDAVAGRFQQTQAPLTPEFTYSNKQVMAEADFRNLHFLNAFVSNGGQIPPRSKTKLQAKVHRHLARQIKTARNMALLPHEGESSSSCNVVAMSLSYDV